MALRIINHSPYLAHTDPLFFQHKTLKVNDIYRLQLGIFMYQLTNNSLPVCFTSLFSKNTDHHSYLTRQASQYHLSHSRTQLSKTSITFEGPKLWNSLDKSLQGSKTTFTFKTNFKKEILNKYNSL